MKLARLLGSVVLFLASMALITGLSLFIVGGYLCTWPILRLSPRSARTRALVQFFVSLMALGSAYGLDSKFQEDSAEQSA